MGGGKVVCARPWAYSAPVKKIGEITTRIIDKRINDFLSIVVFMLFRLPIFISLSLVFSMFRNLVNI